MELQEAVELAISRYVTIEAGTFSGSGVVVTTGLVLTCFHCLHTSDGVTVDGVDAEILGVDPKHDLCLLAVPTEEISTVIIGTPSLGEMVFSVGNMLSLKGVLLFGRVVQMESERIIHDMHGAPGISGSALFDTEGKLIGINHSVIGRKNVGNWLTIAVPSMHLQKIMAMALRIVQPTAEEVEKYGEPS